MKTTDENQKDSRNEQCVQSRIKDGETGGQGASVNIATPSSSFASACGAQQRSTRLSAHTARSTSRAMISEVKSPAAGGSRNEFQRKSDEFSKQF
jgi:hypothetical protein